jgi:hypothetical protein
LVNDLNDIVFIVVVANVRLIQHARIIFVYLQLSV